MASLLEELKLLAQPAPSKIDLDDFEDDLTTAKIINQDELDNQADLKQQERSILRRNADTLLLADEDTKYSGRKISRKDLAKLRDSFSEDDQESIEKSLSDDEKSSDSVESGSEQNEKSGIRSGRDSNSDISDDEVNDIEVERLEGEEDEQDDSDIGDEVDDSDIGDEVDDVKVHHLEGEQDGKMKNFSTDDTNEMEKAKAVVTQLGLWDSCLENRIRLQKSLVQFNKLPQHDVFEEFTDHGGNELRKPLKKAQEMLFDLLHNLMVLQQTLLERNKETRNILCDLENKTDSDEDIPSDNEIQGPGEEEEEREARQRSGEEEEDGDGGLGLSDNDEKLRAGKQRDDEGGRGGIKDTSDDDEPDGLILPKKRRKTMTFDDYSSNIAKRHEAFQHFRDATIKKWNEKTRLASGKVSSKSFSSFDRSTLSQIKQILSDKERLIKRTQLKRSAYRVFGKTELQPSAENEETTDQRNAHLKDYDSEIFDDDDFYHQLLREFIERKSNVDPNDPLAMGRQWLEIQRLRNKVKRKVDTKASKGRRLRYDVHSKLVSFMAPQVKGTMADSSRNELFSSLFGKRQQQSEDVDIHAIQVNGAKLENRSFKK